MSTTITLGEAAELVNGELRGDASLVLQDIQLDSRKCGEGTLFVAKQGTVDHGIRYWEAAQGKGAVALLSDQCPEGAQGIVVPEVRPALARLVKAIIGNPTEALCLIGVTGTNGKTTTAHLIASILTQAGHRCATLGTLGLGRGGRYQHVGLTTPDVVELTRLLMTLVDDGFSHVVMEVSSHALFQGRVDAVAFDAGVLLNLSQEHLDFHETMDAYRDAKTRLVDDFLKPDGVSIVNVDEPWFEAQATSAKLTFSAAGSRQASVRVLSSFGSAHGTEVRLQLPGEELLVSAPVQGAFQSENISASVATCVALGVAPEVMRKGLAALAPVPGRLERVAGPKSVFVDYAHTPDALEKALASLKSTSPGRLWCVFGCGGDRDATKREPMGFLAASIADVVVVTNDNPRSESPDKIADQIKKGVARAGMTPWNESSRGFLCMLDRREAIHFAVQHADPKDTVLVAGKGHETEQIVGDNVLPFDDREVVRDAFASL